MAFAAPLRQIPFASSMVSGVVRSFTTAAPPLRMTVLLVPGSAEDLYFHRAQVHTNQVERSCSG